MIPIDVGPWAFPVSCFWPHEEEEGRNAHGGGAGDRPARPRRVAERGGGQFEEAGAVAARGYSADLW